MYARTSVHSLDKHFKISIHIYIIIHNWASVVAQMVKNLCAVQETRVQSLGREDPLEYKMATHARILA